MKTKPRSREHERALSANNNIHEDIGHIYRSLPLSGNGMLQLSEDKVLASTAISYTSGEVFASSGSPTYITKHTQHLSLIHI